MFAFEIEQFIVCHVVFPPIFSLKSLIKLQLFQKCVFITQLSTFTDWKTLESESEREIVCLQWTL